MEIEKQAEVDNLININRIKDNNGKTVFDALALYG